MSSASNPDDTGRAAALDAFERRAPGCTALLEAALRAQPHDGALLLAHASARAEDGVDDPFDRLKDVLRQDPSWVTGHRALAQLTIEFGFPEPLAVIESALASQRDNPALWHCYLNLLSALGRDIEAADKTAGLRRRVGEVPALRLLEARFAGQGGDPGRGAQLLQGLPAQLPDLAYQQARNALQRGEAGEAAHVLSAAPMQGDMRMWAMAQIAWRALGDDRHGWLVRGKDLLAADDLGLDAQDLATLCDTLRQLHSSRAAPLSQSLRGGTQTRGNLHRREDPVLARVFDAMRRALADYSARLEGLDDDHPMAPLAARAPQITASWSVRLMSGGFHVPHMHDNGLLSSACHLVVPASVAPGEGVLELGRPPKDIALALEPVATFTPRAGRLILFPSFLYHSTTTFEAAERMSVVIDAA